MAKKNILVFPCGSEIGLDIHSSVKYSTHFHLIGGSSIEDHGRYVYTDYIGGIPYVNTPTFIPRIKEIVAERGIDAIYPTMDSVITALKTAEKELGCRVVASPAEVTEICLSKEKTYDRLRDVVRVPAVYDIGAVEHFPVFVKPKVGYGARGTKLVRNSGELAAFTDMADSILVCEYLPGEEYTVDCFTDRSGRLSFCGARVRRRVKAGISMKTSFVDEQQEFLEYAEKINRAIGFRGAWFYQVKRTAEGELCLLEIASRLGGSSLLSRGIGVNFALLSLFDAFDYDVSVERNDYKIELDRAMCARYRTDVEFDTVYVDYDDCLVIDKSRVNTELVAFLYKCVNEGKRLVLLTKHDGDLGAALERHRLGGLFDEVVHIGRDEEKCDYVDGARAIFIDDSHAEREAIRRRRHIPVFAPDMIDVLM